MDVSIEVSIIIPTYHRPHLIQRAVRSVLSQTVQAIEVLVIIDGIDDGTKAMVDRLGDARTRVIETGRNQGPAAARNLGVRQASGQYIALLDDDDEWTTPDKLAVQLKLIEERRLVGDFLIASRSKTEGTSLLFPHDLPRPNQDISEYLLDRRLFRRNDISSDTLLFPRSLALRVPFPDEPIMEDYGWLLLCAAGDRTPLFMCPEATAICYMSPTSRNAMGDWREAIGWLKRYRGHMSGRAMAGLLATTIARHAKQHGNYRAFAEIARTMRGEGDPSLRHWLILGSVAVMPLNLLDHLRRIRERSKSLRRWSLARGV